MLTLWIVFDLFCIISIIYLQKWTFYVYYTVKWTYVKSFMSLSSSSSSEDAKYSQKQVKFTTFEALFVLHGYFMYIIMLQIIRNLVGYVCMICIKPTKAEDLRLWGRHVWDTRIYWRCVQFTVKWARSHAFRSTISRSPTFTLATTVILFLNQRCTKTHMFQEEFMNLGAILNILLSKQYISVFKNHCIANNSTDTQL